MGRNWPLIFIFTIVFSVVLALASWREHAKFETGRGIVKLIIAPDSAAWLQATIFFGVPIALVVLFICLLVSESGPSDGA